MTRERSPGRGTSVARYRARANLAHRRSGLIGLVLLVGLVGGLAMASVAGARRTASSFPTYLASTNPSTLGLISRYVNPALGDRSGYDPEVVRALGRLPLVTQSANAIIFDGNIDLTSVKGIHRHGAPGESPPTVIGSLDGETTLMDRVSLVAGRLADPRRADEAVMNVQAEHQMGVHVGSTISIPLYTDAEAISSAPSKPFLVAHVTLVGVVVAAPTVIQSDADALGSSMVIFSPALTRELAYKCATGTETFLRVQGGDRNAKRVLAEAYKADPFATNFGAQLTSRIVPTIQQTIEPESVALGVFGAIAALSVLLIAGLVMARVVRAGADDLPALRALGAGRAMMMFDEIASVALAVLAGTVLAVGVAIALSPLAPLGPVRPVYPTPGVALDATVLGLGAGLFLVLMMLILGVLGAREVHRASVAAARRARPHESSAVRWVTRSGLPISIATGVRFALEPGRGRNAAPVRSAIVGTVLAVTVLVSTVTFGSSLNALVSRPPLYGWNWQYALLASFGGAEDLPGPQIAALLNHDREVGAWSGMSFAGAKLDGKNQGVLTENPGARVAPPILSGHGLTAANQIVLGSATLAALHKRVGQSVTFDNGASPPTRLLIVGTATMPAITQGPGMGNGALVATSRFPTTQLNLQDATIPGPNVVLVRGRRGVSSAALYASLVAIDHQVNRIPQARGLAGGVVSVLRPVEIVNFRSMGTTPTVLASGLVLGTLVALGLTLTASVRRRRRELALLKALGFAQRQLAAAISWQATVVAVVGAVAGIPLGVVVGRQLWIVFAHSIDAVPAPSVSVPVLVLVGVGSLVFANLIALIPGRSAARTPSALVLRAE